MQSRKVLLVVLLFIHHVLGLAASKVLGIAIRIRFKNHA
jgi:hypothetical protein